MGQHHQCLLHSLRLYLYFSSFLEEKQEGKRKRFRTRSVVLKKGGESD